MLLWLMLMQMGIKLKKAQNKPPRWVNSILYDKKKQRKTKWMGGGVEGNPLNQPTT